MEIQNLQVVDSVEIVILVDNYVDLVLAGLNKTIGTLTGRTDPRH